MILQILLRTVFFYLLIILMLRLLGKREVGELSVVDLIVLLIIADIAVIALENLDKPSYLYIIAIITIAATQKILAFISLKSNFARLLIDGKRSIIIQEGKLNIKEMKSQRYSIDDLLSQTREKGVASLHEIEFAILETSGDLSIFLKKDANPLPIIISGEIVKDNLPILKKTEEWVNLQLKEKNKQIKDVYYANIVNDKLCILNSQQ